MTIISHTQPTLAAIDLGSHSFHLTIGHITEQGELHIDYRLRHVVRLADGLKARSKQLSSGACQRALASLHTFSQILATVAPTQARIVGTETLRNASNQTDFLKAASDVCHHPVEVLSGDEEASLIYLGVAKARAYETQKRLVVDIGGGSTELIIGQADTILETTSLPLGCIAIAKKIHQHNCTMQDTVAQISQQLLDVAYRYTQCGFDTVLGSSGAIYAVAKLLPLLSLTFNYAALLELQQKWHTTPRLITAHLSAHQQAIFPGTLAILLALFTTFKLNTLSAVSSSLAEGLLYQLAAAAPQFHSMHGAAAPE
jgi:exopolyphosphatase / guanosine-5'-triphosphate,3'-diphosphate pyrophosphatase